MRIDLRQVRNDLRAMHADLRALRDDLRPKQGDLRALAIDLRSGPFDLRGERLDVRVMRIDVRAAHIVVLNAPRSASAFIVFGNSIVTRMTGNSWFSTPSPPLSKVKTALTALEKRQGTSDWSGPIAYLVD